MRKTRRLCVRVDEETHEKLSRIVEKFGFSSKSELLLSLLHLLLDRMSDADKRRFDLPYDDARYIDEMFDDLGNSMPTPNGEAPKRRNRRNIDGERY